MLYFWITLVLIALIASIILLRPLRSYPFILSVIGMTAVAIGLYLYWGHSDLLNQYYKEKEKAQEVKKMLKKFKNSHEIIVAMQKAIAKNPAKAKGWYLLGRLYRAEKNHTDAVSAFKKAYELDPNHFSYAFEYLESQYTLSHQKYTPEIQKLMKQLEKQWPNRPELLDFLGYDAYIHGNNEAAIVYWEKLLPYLANNPETRQAVLKAIGKAQKKLVK